MSNGEQKQGAVDLTEEKSNEEEGLEMQPNETPHLFQPGNQPLHFIDKGHAWFHQPLIFWAERKKKKKSIFPGKLFFFFKITFLV